MERSPVVWGCITATWQELIDSFLYEASRRSGGPKRVHVSYAQYG